MIRRKRWIKRCVTMGLVAALIGVLGCSDVDSSTDTGAGNAFVETLNPEDTPAEGTTEGSSTETLMTVAAETSLEESETVEVTMVEETSSLAPDTMEEMQEPRETEQTGTESLPAEIPTTQDAEVETQTTEAPTTETPTTEAPTTAAPTVQSVSAGVRGTYYIGDTLSAADFTVTITMSDGSTKKNPAGWSADQLYLGSSETVVTVSYEGISTTVAVQAVERPTEAPTQAPTEAPDQPFTEAPAQAAPQIDRGMAEAAWAVQKDIIAREGYSMETHGYTGCNIEWSERLYELCCRRVMEITTNFSHDGFHSIDAGAENIAMWCYDASDVVEGWYNSAGHKKNMLGGWNCGAIAYYDGYWVALFCEY